MPDPRRGFIPEDVKEFNYESLKILRRAQQDILYLMEQGYPIKNVSTFVGNHFMLSERQRLAIVRATSESTILEMRRSKELTRDAIGQRVFIDGLNLIITLEVALCEGTLIHCMDHTIRDLAGLRGTYRLIDQTDTAIQLIGDKLSDLKVDEVTFYLDSPVSNTGRLKQKILDLLKAYPFRVNAELVNNADVILQDLDNVVTSDAIILNRCRSWFNLADDIIKEKLPKLMVIDLSAHHK